MMTERPRILFLAHLLPWPLIGGGQIKSYHTLRLLASRFNVRLLAFVRNEPVWDELSDYLSPLQEVCQGGIHLVALPRGMGRNAGFALRSLLGGESFVMTRDAAAPQMREAVQKQLAYGVYAAIHVDHLQMMAFVPDDTHGAKVILDQHNVEHRIVQRLAETPGANPLLRGFARQEWPKLREYERDACNRADKVLVVSREDREALTELDPTLSVKLAITPIGVDLEYWSIAPRTLEAARDLLTIGTLYWPPNVEGIRWFVREILTRIRAEVPGARFNIVGAKPNAAVTALAAADPGIMVAGSVPDVRPYAETCGAFVVPLRAGSGMRVKILTAMAMSLPVISTTVGAEGIAATDGTDILLADTPEAFAAATLRLLREPELAARIGAAGRALMEREYAWEVVGRKLLEVYEEVLSPSPSPRSVERGA